MKAYKTFFNEETGKFDYIEFDIDHEFDFSHDPQTNFTESDNGHTCIKESFMEGLKKDNEKIESGEWKVLKCKDCGRYYVLPKEEEWFVDRGLNPPKRCVSCRGKKKTKTA